MKKIVTFLSTLAFAFGFSQDGLLDTTYGNSGFYTYDSGAYGTCIEIDANQKMVIGTYNMDRTFKFFRFNSSNQLDTTFGSSGSTSINFGGEDVVLYDMKIGADGKIVAVGYWEDTNSINRKDFIVVRLNANGTLDTTFNGTGKVTVAFGSNEDVAHAVAIQNDGKILVAGHSFTGSYRDIAIARINVDGTLDSTFGTNGKVTTDLAGNNDEATCIAINTDGKFAVGSFTYGAGSSTISSDFGIAKYNANGSLDTSFSSDGKHVVVIGVNNDKPESIVFQSNGKILIGGSAFMSSGRDDFAIVRMNTNGTLDTSFNTDGIFTTPLGSSDDTARSMKLLSDGKILLAGTVASGSYTDIGLIRVTSAGNLDTTFGTNGKTQQGYGNLSVIKDMDVMSDGKIMVCGSAGTTNIFLARFGGSTPLFLETNDLRQDKKELSVYPNPVSDVLYSDEKLENFELYSANGSLIRSGKNENSINVQDLPKGVYMLKIKNKEISITKKIIKN
ncbi:T9SS type A sorting domain-containing protein [Chryseobacterium sp. MMS23-Vi53]|uniref:T9SS type A sorting domain-containing protein n=1 Tax=Chryseobacterium sp. MMS23-Vi53 TaxID=3386644 RepID=UPI0039E962F0